MEKIKKHGKGSFLKGAAWIAAGGFIAKILGALYRIPLTNAIGGHGLGLYQMAYPVYCLLLTVSATGIPSSISKLTAERLEKGESDTPLFVTAMRLFLGIGFCGSLLMCVIAPFLARAQGAREITAGYFTLAPSVVLVSAISVFRGWFQGRNQMHPTALSEITEQAVKVGFGLFFAWFFRENVARAVTFLLLAVSISEFAALGLMLFLHRRVKKSPKEQKAGGRVSMKSILRLSIPVTFSSSLIPLSGLLDSVLAPKFLGAYASDPVALFGLFAGGAVTIINLPVSICYGIAAASVPAVAAAAVKKKGARKKLFFSLLVTVGVALPSALGLYLFAEPATRIIFRSLQSEELATLARLVRVFSISTLTLSLTQTLSACLTAQGKPQYAALSMLVAVTVKTGLYAWWLQKPSISVYGLAYATNICYLIAFLLDLVYNLKVSKKEKE